jgi:hypothetical protein
LKPLTALVRASWSETLQRSLERIGASRLIEAFLFQLPPDGAVPPRAIAGVPTTGLVTEAAGSTLAVRELLDRVATPFLLLLEPGSELDPVPHALERLLDVAQNSGAALTYGDYLDWNEDRLVPHPLADYQEGSLGEGFDLGPLALWSTSALTLATRRHGWPADDLIWHAWYDLRLKASTVGSFVRLPEPLAARRPVDARSSGVAVFDYLTAGRPAQREAENVATAHLGRIGARVEGPFRPYVSAPAFPVEASVIIPVRNRVLTVADAVKSALSQRTDFPFNVIVVDNHSIDGTTEVLRDLASRDNRVIHALPERWDLGIGGCWNEAVFHPHCGRFAVQLDSDDLYSGQNTLSRLVGKLCDEQCAMVIGSYTTVDLSLEQVPPGLIDHREWSDDNGPNNALRIEGLGAPRAFHTELLRCHPFPNVSYGEDYAVVLRICREYKVGRIYDSLYHCRRWADNTDADLTPEVVVRHRTYKDRLRTLEIAARRWINRPAEGGA